MAELPTGTLTFLLTDIEGSTGVWEAEPAAMREAVTLHDAIVEGVIHKHGGRVVRPRGEGDSRFAVFSAASSALAAAVTLQRDLWQTAWPTPEPIRVRIALTTGEADLRAGDYYGTAPNRCGRLRAIAAGGQLLVAGDTVAAARDRLPSGIELRNLGHRKLRDVREPVQIYQVLQPGLPNVPPDLGAISAWTPLPKSATPLIDRNEERRELRGLLRRGNRRLVTILGPGGAGKTRLAIAVAQNVADDIPVCFVDLAPVREPAMVVGSIAHALGLRDAAPWSMLESIRRLLSTTRMLLVLDNFEQVLPAASTAIHIVESCPSVSVLVTSREPLHVDPEQIYVLRPLSVPAADVRGVRALLKYPAAALFVERARAKGGFRVTSDNAGAVSELCRRLDGLPLAIELAAARTATLGARTLIDRLDRSTTDVLKYRVADIPERHHSMYATITWSYELLSDRERALFRRLAVFRGSWTIATAERVCADAVIPAGEVLDLVCDLADKSLVYAEEHAGEVRYRLLEPVRQYAAEQLDDSGEQESIVLRHAEWCRDLVQQALAVEHGAELGAWLDTLEVEHQNLRAGLDRAARRGDVHWALQLATLLEWFWELRGYLGEGRARLSALLASSSEVPPRIRGWALIANGFLAFLKGEAATAVVELESALAIFRAHADVEGISWAAAKLGVVLVSAGEQERAAHLFQEAESIAAQQSNLLVLTWATFGLAHVALARGDLASARARLERALGVVKAIGHVWGIAAVEHHLGRILRIQGELETALDLEQDSLRRWWGLGDHRASADSVEVLALLAADAGAYEQAARLLAASDAAREVLGAGVLPYLGADRKQMIERMRSALGTLAFEIGIQHGHQTPLAEAVADALSVEPLARRRERRLEPAHDELSARLVVGDELPDHVVER